MWKKTGVLLGVMTAVVFMIHGVSQAAYFEGVGPHLSMTDTISINMAQDCYGVDTSSGTTIKIMPSPGEQIGDPVTVSYCWSGTGTTHITGEGYTAVGGIGGSVSAFSDCNAAHLSYSASGNATVSVIHNGNPTPVISYAATIIQNGQSITIPQTCGTFQAQIGDELQGAGGVFAALAGPTPNAGTNASLTFAFEATLPTAGIPTFNEWGMIIFSLLLAGTAVYMMRKRYSHLI